VGDGLNHIPITPQNWYVQCSFDKRRIREKFGGFDNFKTKSNNIDNIGINIS
jgi:hypothetical protein